MPEVTVVLSPTRAREPLVARAESKGSHELSRRKSIRAAHLGAELGPPVSAAALLSRPYSAACAPRAAAIACQTTCGVAGMSRWVTRKGTRASESAFITVGGAPVAPASPQPFAPKGLVVAGTSMNSTPTGGAPAPPRSRRPRAISRRARRSGARLAWTIRRAALYDAICGAARAGGARWTHIGRARPR